jgi:hypothetical protein
MPLVVIVALGIGAMRLTNRAVRGSDGANQAASGTTSGAGVGGMGRRVKTDRQGQAETYLGGRNGADPLGESRGR